MKSVLIVATVVGAAALAMPSNAAAQTVFTATLTGGAQAPVIASPGSGTGAVLLNAGEDEITVNLSFSGLTSAANAAHIHGPGAVGINAGILFPFTNVPTATSGSIPEQTFAITPAQVSDLKAGLYYFNVHTGVNPGGEIRGQIGAAPVLTVTRSGTSSTVTSSPGGVACGADCVEAFDSGTTVTLAAAQPPPGSYFAGSSGGGCSGTINPCTVTMSADTAVTATFLPTSFAFTDDLLTARGTPVKAVHVLELRQAINTLRFNNMLPPFVFTDTLTAGTTVISAVHVSELRTALNAVYVAKGLAPPTYTDPAVAAGIAVKAVHVAELRFALRQVE
ncbi:MAG TPA: CHRD domain-containing protein [Vicinamibacterales bacterium]|nr:CHRD domain-containing protein [Vicinamibacterales bacterium]